MEPRSQACKRLRDQNSLQPGLAGPRVLASRCLPGLVGPEGVGEPAAGEMAFIRFSNATKMSLMPLAPSPRGEIKGSVGRRDSSIHHGLGAGSGCSRRSSSRAPHAPGVLRDRWCGTFLSKGQSPNGLPSSIWSGHQPLALYWGREDSSRTSNPRCRYLKLPEESSWWFEWEGALNLGSEATSKKNTPGEQTDPEYPRVWK